MYQGTCPQGVRSVSVHPLQQVVAVQGIDFLVQPSRADEQEHQKEHQVDHDRTKWVVTRLRGEASCPKLCNMLANSSTADRKVGEPRMPATNKTPAHAEQHGRPSRIAEPGMDVFPGIGQ